MALIDLGKNRSEMQLVWEYSYYLLESRLASGRYLLDAEKSSVPSAVLRRNTAYLGNRRNLGKIEDETPLNGFSTHKIRGETAGAN